MPKTLTHALMAIPLWGVVGCLGTATASGEDAPSPSKPEPRVLTFDLATQRKTDLRVAPGVYKVVLESSAPGGRYVVTQESVQLVETPLALPAPGTVSIKTPSPPSGSQCDTTLDQLAQADLDEEHVLSRLAAAAQVSGCSSTQRYKDLSQRTRIEINHVSVAEGEDLEITVRRAKPSQGETGADWKEKSDKRWLFALTTVGRGAWLTSYGFAFAADEDERYFAKSTETAGKFTITAETDRGTLSYIPTVFFSWFSRKDLRRTWSWGPSGGVGFDQTKPSVFLGLRGSHGQNLSLIAGAVVRPVTRLAGEYTEGQEVADTVSPDKLVDTTYRPTYFVALSFRFGTNPHVPAAPTSGAPAKEAKTEAGK